jgi:hypothetical protein
MHRHLIPGTIEEYRDARWQRDEQNRVETAIQAERFIERVGFASCLLDSRQTGPSLYIAVCGRRDAVLPRNVQKDPETSQTWFLKDEVLRRGKVFYGKLRRGKATFVAPRMILSARPNVRRAPTESVLCVIGGKPTPLAPP